MRGGLRAHVVRRAEDRQVDDLTAQQDVGCAQDRSSAPSGSTMCRRRALARSSNSYWNIIGVLVAGRGSATRSASSGDRPRFKHADGGRDLGLVPRT